MSFRDLYFEDAAKRYEQKWEYDTCNTPYTAEAKQSFMDLVVFPKFRPGCDDSYCAGYFG